MFLCIRHILFMHGWARNHDETKKMADGVGIWWVGHYRHSKLPRATWRKYRSYRYL